MIAQESQESTKDDIMLTNEIFIISDIFNEHWEKGVTLVLIPETNDSLPIEFKGRTGENLICLGKFLGKMLNIMP
jgi:hypothetical protein